MISISIKLKTYLLGIYFILKVGSIALSGVQKKCVNDIRGPRYKQIKMGYEIEKKWMLDNLES